MTCLGTDSRRYGGIQYPSRSWDGQLMAPCEARQGVLNYLDINYLDPESAKGQG